MKQIQLYNRDGADLKLVQIEGNTYQLTVDKEHDYVLEYCRIGLNNPSGIAFVDPAGGPMLKLNSTIGPYEIQSIIVDKNIKIILQEQWKKHNN